MFSKFCSQIELSLFLGGGVSSLPFLRCSQRPLQATSCSSEHSVWTSLSLGVHFCWSPVVSIAADKAAQVLEWSQTWTWISFLQPPVAISSLTPFRPHQRFLGGPSGSCLPPNPKAKAAYFSFLLQYPRFCFSILLQNKL